MGSERNKCNERIGEVRYNRHGEKMVIVDYIKYNDLAVMFEDGSIREHVRYSEFKQGTLKNHLNADVYGVGVSGYTKKKQNGKMTKEYRTWANMLARCYNKEKQREFPRYKGCSVSEEWLFFDNFLKWCHEQENWNKVVENPSGFHLDKDIITKNNKVYSPDDCCFVPANVNVLFTSSNKTRGDYPVGVSVEPHSNRLRARCNMTLINVDSTYHLADTIEEAFEYYKKDKEYLIKEVAKREFSLGNITKRCYESMMKYQVEITD